MSSTFATLVAVDLLKRSIPTLTRRNSALETSAYTDTDIIGSSLRESVDGVAIGGGTDLSGLELELAEAAKVVAATSPIDANANVIGKGELVLRRSPRKTSKPAPAKRTSKQEKPATTTCSSKMPAATISVEAREKLRYPGLAESSDRLEGVSLVAMRDASKNRTYDKFEEASYTKQKRIKAEKAAADLKKKLTRATQSSADSFSELVKTIMILRADADREGRARVEAAENKRAAEREALEVRRREERREQREAA
ncbi:hypothetical protein GN958_ATG06699 [Phytophthora infestans]|uniref:Uncharacterized protein n=1 Tax=Phytophthora infestans TaxID=4787 RepID=A0A8S9UWI9_PHYIN|nr:hypothetical protein GN958_ATG06699 [Phytophthora infestans]